MSEEVSEITSKLQAYFLRTHLQEEEIGCLVVDQKFDSTSGSVLHALGERNSSLAELLSQTRMLLDKGAWAFFDDFLMSPLDRALSFAKADGLTLAVAEYLYLDVVALRVVSLDEHSCILEERLQAVRR